jgi:glucan phosphoethanolaminetransferase (alkaline phosphatase superfamily)
MNAPLLFLFALVAYLGWRAWRRLPVYDRSFATRGGLALLLINFLVILALVFLPGRLKLFALFPAILTIGSTVKLLQNARQNVRGKVNAEARFARAKRVN